jgi:hypothetical protein
MQKTQFLCCSATVALRCHDIFHCCVHSHRHRLHKYTIPLLFFTSCCLAMAGCRDHKSCFECTCHIAPSLRLLVPSSLQAYRHFLFSQGCARDVCDQPHLPSPWLSSHSDYSPTAPSLRPLDQSSSLRSWEPYRDGQLRQTNMKLEVSWAYALITDGLFPVLPTSRNCWQNSWRRSKPSSGLQKWRPHSKH